jgi:tRNA modification GTPase
VVTNLRHQLDRRALSEQTFRAVLAGRPNAGKSSLFNALSGARALVSQEPGTTRDYLMQRLHLDGNPVDLIDTAGWQPSADAITTQAQELGRDQRQRADLVLLCVEAGLPLSTSERDLLSSPEPPVLVVATKCDLASAPPDQIATSARTGMGLEGLRTLLRQRAQQHGRPALAPSLARCRNHVQNCLEQLRRAHHLVLEGELPEVLALELRGALNQLGEMVGAVYTDDLLDRIFGRFCIGK